MDRSIETNDIVLAAVLRTRGFNLDRIEKIGTRGVFCFSNVPDSLVTEVDLGKCLVEPVSFNNAIKVLTTSVRRVP